MFDFRSRLFGLPTLIAIKYKGCTYEYLYNSILDRMALVANIFVIFYRYVGCKILCSDSRSWFH